MSNNSKENIISLPQRNRRKYKKNISSDEEKEQEENIIKTLNNKVIDIDKYSKFKNKTYQYEYLDHTADVILYSKGKTLIDCFESTCIAMFNYMCDLSYINDKETIQISVSGTDLNNLLYNFLNEFLFVYGSLYFICKIVHIYTFNETTFFINAIAYGEKFDSSKHISGTEIKAITKHELKIISKENEYEIFVLVDI